MTAARATLWLLAGVGTAFLALVTTALVLLTLLLSLIGVGLFLLGPVLQVTRWVAEVERRRLRGLGHRLVSPYGAIPKHWRQVWRFALSDASTRRDCTWLLIHGTLGLVLGLIPLEFASNAIQDSSVALWWRLAPAEATFVNGLFSVESWPQARAAVLAGFIWALLWFWLSPHLLRWQVLPGRRILAPHPDIDLSERVAQLTASRAAALDAHAVELRRIERALHDGAQNRLVATAVLTGAARQALARDRASADPLLERAQASAELALAELRSVVRSILPPVLEANGLPGALTALAAQCPVQTRVNVPEGLRGPIAIEAVAYYTVAEALTNVARHSGAERATVVVELREEMLTVQIGDDGAGGAEITPGSGLSGIAQRVQAHDGILSLISPAGGPTTLEVNIPCD